MKILSNDLSFWCSWERVQTVPSFYLWYMVDCKKCLMNACWIAMNGQTSFSACLDFQIHGFLNTWHGFTYKVVCPSQHQACLGPSPCCVSWLSSLWGLPLFPWVEFFLSSLCTLLYFSAHLKHAQSLGFVHQILNLRWYDALDYSTPTKWPNLDSFHPELLKCMIPGKALNSLNFFFFLYPAGVMWYLCERLSWGRT